MKCVSRAVVAMVLAFLAACGGRVSLDAKVEPLPADIQGVIDKVDKDPVWDGADIGLAIRGAKLADLINSINALPPESRQVLVGVSKANGKLEDNGN